MRHRKTFSFRLSAFGFSSGFTLIEILVVLGIMALLTTMSIPAFSGYLKNARLRGGARQIASALRQARTQAITKRIQQAVLLYFQDPNAANFYNGVSVYENNTLSYKHLPETIRLKDENGNNGSNGDLPDLQVTFKATGSITNGSDVTVRVYDVAGNYREITVVKATGQVKVK